jgi:tetratricopeptide (TPR) repeat protein
MWEGYEKTASDIKGDEEFIEQAIKLAKGDAAKAAQNLIQIGWSRIGKDPNHAIRAFNQAWLIEPNNPEIFWGFGIASHIRNDALKVVRRWFTKTRELIELEGSPTSARLEADYGRILTERNCHKEAKPFFEKALAINPDYDQAHIGMINVGAALGDEDLKQKHQKNPYSKPWRNRLSCHQNSKTHGH